MEKKGNNFAKNGRKNLKKISQDREMSAAPYYIKIWDIGHRSKPTIEFCRFNCSIVHETKRVLCVNWDFLEVERKMC